MQDEFEVYTKIVKSEHPTLMEPLVECLKRNYESSYLGPTTEDVGPKAMKLLLHCVAELGEASAQCQKDGDGTLELCNRALGMLPAIRITIESTKSK